MRFNFEILWMRDGHLEPLFHPDAVNLQSLKTARGLAERFASYFPVQSITIKSDDGSISERWSGLNETWSRNDTAWSSVVSASPLAP